MAEQDIPMHSEEYQIKVLSYMLANYDFATIAKEADIREFYANKALQWYHDTITNATIPLTPALLKEELIKATKSKVIREHEIDKVVSYFNWIKQPPLPSEEEHIQVTFGSFIRRQAMKQALLDSMDDLKQDAFDECIERIEIARNKGMDILTIGHRFFGDYENRLARRLQKDDVRRLSTGIPELDTLMYGGLKNKQMGLVVGGTGRGKSIFLEWIARVGVLLGQQVVYYTLELSEEDIAERFDALFCHIKPQELKSMNDRVYQEIHKYHERFGNNLIIKEYPEDEMSINTMTAHYKSLSSIGVRPGLVVVDYIDLMKPHRTYHDVNQEQIAIAKACRGFTKKFDTRLWSALQLNRGGMVAETPDEGGVAGSIGRLYTADAVIMLAQTAEEREDEVMRLFMKKNRNGPAERTIKIATDFSHMTFYRSSITSEVDITKQQYVAPVDDDNGVPVEALQEEGAVVLD